MNRFWTGVIGRMVVLSIVTQKRRDGVDLEGTKNIQLSETGQD